MEVNKDVKLQNKIIAAPTGCPKKVFVYKKLDHYINEHFFWDTWYKYVAQTIQNYSDIRLDYQ